ncbi:hypothetical protein [Perlabentimonas gracilis]|uniref:hypothetical protein n=1 Tax=Perlabentimonas gracilis TaxID=2715279 RepID=UPI0014094D4F|nr:hypothetical protein [Perlabentimonas gracilis]NHB70225.1 hypothetical protein [Perlabentimonas gracilis]
MEYFKTFILCLSLLFFSCSNLKNENQNEIKTLDTQQIEKNPKEKKDFNNKKDSKPTYLEIEDPKVLTYEEIFEKNENIQKQYISSLPFASDSLELKERLNNNFFRHITTQFKYMLSSELRILRNCFNPK